MKKILLVFVFIPILSYAQLGDTSRIKGANKVMIKNDKSARQNLYILQKLLTKEGYKIDVDPKYSTIKTQDSIIEKGSVSYTLMAFAGDRFIDLIGNYRSAVITADIGGSKAVYTYPIVNTGSRDSRSQKVFSILESTAREIKGRVYYIKEKRKSGAIF